LGFNLGDVELAPIKPKSVSVGLTGGIATGKSTAAGMFRSLGAAVIDADHVARELARPGQNAWHEAVAALGREILTDREEIDWSRLAPGVNQNPRAKRKLETILQPHVRQAMEQRRQELIRAAQHRVILMDIPLLFETGQQERWNEIIVVHIPEDLQLTRLIKRDGLQRAAARKCLDAQMSIEIKRLMATRLIDNSGTRAQTRSQVQKIYHQLKAHA